MITEWWYEGCGSFPYLLKIDEDSSEDELEAEIEYWMGEVKTYDPSDPHRKALMSAVRWMMGLLSNK